MKKIKKSKLIIENKKITIKEDSDYEALGKTMPVGDIAKFGKDSLKLLGNIANYWKNTGWTTFRYAILKNLNKKDFDSALKNGRITFLSNADRNISSIDSTTATLLSKAGISKSEIDSCLLGFPGFNVLEKLDVTDILTGRIFDSSRYNGINMTNASPEDLLLYFTIAELSNGIGDDLKMKSDSEIFEIVNKIPQSDKNAVLLAIKTQLSAEKDLLRKLKALTKSTDDNLLTEVRKIMRPNANQPGSIKSKSAAENFIKLVNKDLPKMKMSITDSYKLSIKGSILIKEASVRDDANLIVLSFLHSIAKSVMFVESVEAKRLLERILKTAALQDGNSQDITDFDKLKDMLEIIAIAIWCGQAACNGINVLNKPKTQANNDIEEDDLRSVFDEYKKSIDESSTAIKGIINKTSKRYSDIDNQRNVIKELVDTYQAKDTTLFSYKQNILTPIINDAKNSLFDDKELEKLKNFIKVVVDQFSKDFLKDIDSDFPTLIDYCSSEKLKSRDDLKIS
jgi:hypothetical protein